MSLGAQLGRYWLRVGRYLKRVAIAADQLANAVRGGNPDETLSSAAQKARERWIRNTDTPADRRAYLWGVILLWPIERIWPGHGLGSVERDETK